MDMLRGTASKVRHTVEISSAGGGRHDSVSTTHLCLLQLQDRMVRLQGRQPLIVHDGDQLEVAGPVRQGVLRALAHANLSTGTQGDEGVWQHAIASPVCLGAAMVVWQAMDGFRVNDVPLQWLPAAVFAGIGLYLAQRGLRIWQAVQQVRQACGR